MSIDARPGNQAEFLQRVEDVVLWVEPAGWTEPAGQTWGLLMDWAKYVGTSGERGCLIGSRPLGDIFGHFGGKRDGVSRFVWLSGATLELRTPQDMQGREFDWIGVDHAEALDIESVSALLSRRHRGGLRMVSRGMPAWLDPDTRDGRIAVVETSERAVHPARARTVEMGMAVEA